MVMHEQDELFELMLPNKGSEISIPDINVLERDQQLDFSDFIEQTSEDLFFESMDSFMDTCPPVEVAETVEIPSELDCPTSSSVPATSGTQYIFQFPVTTDTDEPSITTIDFRYLTEVNEIGSFADEIAGSIDVTDTDSVYSTNQNPPSCSASPSYSLPPPTPDTASSSSSNVPSFVKEELKLAIKTKRPDLKVEFVEPPPEQLTEEEELKRIEKREKNKLAAQKCREKKRIIAEKLEAETRVLQRTQNKYKIEIQKLLDEREQLMELIKVHKTVCPRFRTRSSNI